MESKVSKPKHPSDIHESSPTGVRKGRDKQFEEAIAISELPDQHKV